MRKIILFILLFLPSLIVISAVSSDDVSAQVFNRGKWYGYFNNDRDTSGDRLEQNGIDGSPGEANIDTLAELIDYYERGVNSSTSSKFYTTASFTVLHMLGAPPGTAKSEGRTRFAEWERKVTAYHNAGRINYNQSFSFDYNTYWQDSGDNDVAWYEESDTQRSIVFTHPDGTTYAIKKNCANPVGEPQPLQEIEVEIQTHGFVVDEDGNKLREMPMTFTTSGHSSGQYNDTRSGYEGYRYFKVIKGNSFSITNVTASGNTANLSGPFIRPYGNSGATADNYYDCNNGPYRGNPSVGQNNGSPGWCSSYSNYYCQYAGIHYTADNPGSCTPTHDRSRDNGYDFVWVEAFSAPTCSPSTQTVFTGSNASISASGGNGTYSWSTSGSNNNNQTGSTFSARWSSTGSKTVTVTSAGKTASCTVVVQNLPNCSPNNQTAFRGESVSISASGGNGTYSWSTSGSSNNNQTGSTFTASWSSTGNKTVTVRSDGRSDTCNVNVVPRDCDGIRNANPGISGWPNRIGVTLTNGTTVGGKSGYSTSPNQSHDEYIRNGIVVNSTSDTSPGGTHNISIPYNNFSQSSNSSNATVELDYEPFIVNCPYDANQATVNYTYKYKKQNWRSSSSPSTYDCPNGGTRSGTTCYKSTTKSCSGYESDGHCYANRTRVNKYRNTAGNCAAGNVGSYCGYFYTYSNDIGYTYSCPSGWSKISQSTCSQSARPLYAWNRNGGESNGSEKLTKAGPTMEPCDRRTYSAESVVATANLDSDTENPSSSEVNGVIRVDFGVRDESRWGGRNSMRIASSVRLPYAFHYRIGGGGWNNVSGGSGSTTITSGSKNKTANNQDSSSLSANVSVNVPNNLLPGDTVEWRLVTGDSSSRVNGTIDNATVIMSSSGGTDSDERDTPRVENWPYMKVYGGDVSSGGNFGSCSSAGSTGTNSIYRTGSYGTAVQYAIFSVGSSIRGASSTGLKDGQSAPSPIKGLSFANTGGTFGGNLSGGNGTGCLPDYYANANDQNVTAMPTNGSAVSRGGRIRTELETPTTSTNPSHVDYYRMDGDVVIRGGGDMNVQNNTKKVFYVNGTVWIDRNIIQSDGWTDRSDIPFTAIIARNIVIDDSVTRLDGLFVAQPGVGFINSGNIWTCDETSQNNIWSSCGNQLNVRGALVAENVHFMRSHGSLRDGTANEGRSNTDPAGNGTWNSRCGTRSGFAPTANGTAGGNTCAAEVITYSPSLLMSISLILSPGSNFTYDSFVVSAPNL